MFRTSDRIADIKEYYFVKALEELETLRSQGYRVINFSIGKPDMPPPPEAVAALCHTAALDSAHGYQAYRGTPKLRAAIAKFYQKNYGISLDPNSEVLPLAGSKEGILHLSLAYLNQSDGVLVPNPGYPTYTSVTKIAGGVPVFYDLTEENGWYPDMAKLEEQADNHAPKMMWVNYPHMPTGAPANPQKLQSILDFCRRRNILLCFDNPYSMVLNTGQPFSILSLDGAGNHCVELNSLSKSTNMSGWRVGMMVGNKEVLAAALTVKSNMDSGMFLPVQEGAIAALEVGSEWHAQRNDVYARRRKLVMELFHRLNCRCLTQTEGMFVWARIPDAAPDADGMLKHLLYEKHIFLTPGHIFGSNGTRYLRASLCVEEADIKEAISRL